jgi:hypothetical protein
MDIVVNFMNLAKRRKKGKECLPMSKFKCLTIVCCAFAPAKN